MTPEGRVKKRIRDLLNRYDGMWVYMPVPSGYGRRTLDYLCCYHGRFFAIEAKKPGGKTTTLQDLDIAAISTAGGATFVIEDDAGIFLLKRWLDDVHLEKLPAGSPAVS